MKVYISADIEGITGTTHWDETDIGKPGYDTFREQMTAETVAACEGALEAGATEIWVKDAHDSTRNIIAAKLPHEAKLVRGWSGHPFLTLQELDKSFDAVALIGYHSRAGSAANPLAHTMSGSDAYVKINDRFASEFLINTYTAALEGVPVVFVAGDAGLCAEAAEIVPGISSVAVKDGLGGSTNNLHPLTAVEKIRSGVEQALRRSCATCLVELPRRFTVEIRYNDDTRAYSNSFFPGASLKDPFTIQFKATDYFEVLRLFTYVF